MARTALVLTVVILAACGDETGPDAEDAPARATAGGEEPEVPMPNSYPVTAQDASLLLPPEAADDAKITLIGPASACEARALRANVRADR